MAENSGFLQHSSIGAFTSGGVLADLQNNLILGMS